MFTLSEASLQRGYEAILHHGYSDFFPAPPEFDVVSKGWSKLKPELAATDLTTHRPYRPISAFAPKSKINLRPVVLLHPVDLIFYTSLVADLLPSISKHRLPAEKVFSFRSESAPQHALYSDRSSHANFETAKYKHAAKYKKGYMGFADIADFYPRMYQHKVRNALDACVDGDPQLAVYPGLIEKLLRGFTHDNLSYGVPIGPAASRPLAEAGLIDIDNALVSFGVGFIRYIDDFVFFAPTREKVEWALRTLGELLDKRQGLSLHAAKTRVMRCSTFIEKAHREPDAEDSVEAKFAELIENRFYDEEWRTLDDLDQDEKDALDAIDLGAVLKEALDEDDTDYKKIAFILDRLSSLERADMIPIVLDHLPRLYPVAHAMNAFFRNVGRMDAKTTKQCARQLLRPILAGKNENAPEFYSMWILDLFRLKPDWNEAASLAKIFRTVQSQAVRRYAALALASTGSRSEAIDLKDAFTGSESLTRSALLLATKKLGADERRHWIRRLDLSPFEKFLLANA
jgi:Reverse transcriptase (RNA-dependent DNA polymerase)